MKMWWRLFVNFCASVFVYNCIKQEARCNAGFWESIVTFCTLSVYANYLNNTVITQMQ